jgi:hypothetical protein
MRLELLLILGVFAVATAVAALAGATNFGTALTFGQLAAAATGVWIILRRP